MCHNVGMSLTIDTAAAVVQPDDADVHAWMADQRVFVSSVMAGMACVRQVVADAIAGAGASPVYFEDFGGRDDDAEAAYLGEVASSTIYLALLGGNYGQLLRSRLSATHEEYRAAERGGLSISAWVEQGANYNADQAGFIDEVRLFHTTGSYRTSNDLAAAIVRRLQAMAASDLSPWIKLGELVFRARKITDDGNRISIDASLRNPHVVSALEQLRPRNWGGRQESQLTYNGRSQLARILSVVSTMTSRTSTHAIIDLEYAAQSANPMPVSLTISGRSYNEDELSELHIRHALFGEPMPKDVRYWGDRIDDPFSDLPVDLPSDELQKAVLRLVITECLIKAGRASRVDRIEISPPGPAGRSALISLSSATARAGAPRTLTVDGTLRPTQP